MEMLINTRCRVVFRGGSHTAVRFLDWSRYFFFEVAPQLYSQGCAPRSRPITQKIC
jgi:hypothetical protein